MKIELIANDGSPLKVIPPYIHQRGVGGAELAMMTLMETLAKRGHEVHVYNNPDAPGTYSGVAYHHLAEFNTEHKRDVLIIFRSPNPRVHFSRLEPSQRVIWWSCDQYTVGDFSALAQMVDFCVTISPFHTNYHVTNYAIPAQKIGHIDIGVRDWEYREEVAKIKNRLIFCSIPDRGLKIMREAYPHILKKVPDVSIAITSDYTLWGAPSAGNQKHRLGWVGLDGVNFVGNVPRSQLVKLQMEAEIMSYPSTYQELFCISAAECQVAGAVPITSTIGALQTTNEFGIKIPGNPTTTGWQNSFTENVIDLLTTKRDELERMQTISRRGAMERFNYEGIALKWEKLFETGKLK